jgi:hypothetical protein
MFNEKEYQKKYREEHKKENKQYRIDYYIENYEKALLYAKNYRIVNKKAIAYKKKKYYDKNKEMLLQRKKDIHYFKNRLAKDINFKLSRYLSCRIWHALKRNIKSARTLELLGCSIEFLKGYLASKFIPGMTWENYGKWHVDHIKPCASYDLSNESEQKLCFNYTNLQPLWAEDNLSKSDNYRGDLASNHNAKG